MVQETRYGQPVNPMNAATICAIATPVGKGGIGIVKISGPDALAVLNRIFTRSRDPAKGSGGCRQRAAAYQTHRIYHGFILDSSSQRIIDEVLALVMKGPLSYTKEDVVEIHAHGGPAVLDAVLDQVLRSGARLAEPGEFTRRAFINGRIDLTQAEAVMDVIHAESRAALGMAAVQLKGGLRDRIEAVRNALLSVQAEIEAALDFPEDAEDGAGPERLCAFIQAEVLNPLQTLLDQYAAGHVYREGLRLVVVGKPNVGKSSLMNRLLKKNRVIVSSMPGTTRDFIEETVVLGQIPLILTDSAGIHETDDLIEKIGMEKTGEVISQADLVLFVLDSSRPPDGADRKIFGQIRDKSVILVLNKTDLLEPGRSLDLPADWMDLPRVSTSALHGQGIGDLEKLITRTITGKERFDAGAGVIPNRRHRQALEIAFTGAMSVRNGLENRDPFELLAVDVREAMGALGQIVGVTDNEELLDRIFSRFCIGK